MDKLNKLLDKCKCGVFVIVNEHRNYYMSAEQKLEDLACLECPPEIADEVRDKMIETDTIIDIQFYPDTPIGSYSVYHYDIDIALSEAFDCLEQKEDNNAGTHAEGKEEAKA